MVTEHTAVAKRRQKLIESANLKRGQVASDVLGLSGRLMLRALAEGEQDVTKLAGSSPPVPVKWLGSRRGTSAG